MPMKPSTSDCTVLIQYGQYPSIACTIYSHTHIWVKVTLVSPIPTTKQCHVDMPASTQMTESPINSNTMNSAMRVEGRVTCPSKSTPTECRYAVVMRDGEE